ncbi:MAG: virulence-associated protein E, partial [Rhodobacteraceae bacterium]|nr:virulence-associated protein E [Paracoccaceae bacterium]
MDAQNLTRQLGGKWHGGAGQAPCPVCQPERRRDQNALSLKDGTNGTLLLYCFKSGCSFEELTLSLSLPFKKAALDFDAQRKAKEQDSRIREKNLGTARAMWQRAQPIAGSKAEAYLRARGITCPMPETLRFVPDLYHAPSGQWCCAMLGNIEPTGGVHRTFFSKQG